MNDFTRQYIDTALWSSTDESTLDGGNPMDASYGVGDMSMGLMAEMVADCVKFQADNAEDMEPFEASTCGHDFWLTRCGHGAGFWDGDYPEPAASALTKAAQTFGNFYIYVGDDGQLYGDKA